MTDANYYAQGLNSVSQYPNNPALSGLYPYSAAGVNDAARQLMAATARKPSSLPLRQRGDAERLRKPVKIRRR